MKQKRKILEEQHHREISRANQHGDMIRKRKINITRKNNKITYQ